MTIKEKFLGTLKAVKEMTDNENIYNENNKPLFNIDEEITRLSFSETDLSLEKEETPISRFNILVNQLESVHSNLFCTVIELLETTNGEALEKEITIENKTGKISDIFLAEMYTFIILRTNFGDCVYNVKSLSNEDLISIGMLF